MLWQPRTFQSWECVRYRVTEPTNKSAWWTRSPRVYHIIHKVCWVEVDLFLTCDSISSFQHCSRLLLDGQGFVIRHRVRKVLVWAGNFGRVVSHDLERCCGHILIRVKTRKRRVCYNRLICTRRPSHLELEVVWYPCTRESVDLVVFIHLCILSPNKHLRLGRNSRVVDSSSVWTHSNYLSFVAQCFIRLYFRHISESDLLLLQIRGRPGMHLPTTIGIHRKILSRVGLVHPLGSSRSSCHSEVKVWLN